MLVLPCPSPHIRETPKMDLGGFGTSSALVPSESWRRCVLPGGPAHWFPPGWAAVQTNSFSIKDMSCHKYVSITPSEPKSKHLHYTSFPWFC